jgi:hypothetical protein
MAWEMFAKLREQPTPIAFSDSLIVEYHESHIGLREWLLPQVFTGVLTKQPPRTFYYSEDKFCQRLVVGEEQ